MLHECHSYNSPQCSIWWIDSAGVIWDWLSVCLLPTGHTLQHALLSSAFLFFSWSISADKLFFKCINTLVKSVFHFRRDHQYFTVGTSVLAEWPAMPFIRSYVISNIHMEFINSPPPPPCGMSINTRLLNILDQRNATRDGESKLLVVAAAAAVANQPQSYICAHNNLFMSTKSSV